MFIVFGFKSLYPTFFGKMLFSQLLLKINNQLENNRHGDPKAYRQLISHFFILHILSEDIFCDQR